MAFAQGTLSDSIAFVNAFKVTLDALGTRTSVGGCFLQSVMCLCQVWYCLKKKGELRLKVSSLQTHRLLSGVHVFTPLSVSDAAAF